MDILEEIKRSLTASRDGIGGLLSKVDVRTVQAVELMLASKGRVVVSGVGKTGIIGRKIAATLSSTGTPALYLHPAEALHGDLGAVQAGDIALIISNSGESAEITALIPHLRALEVNVIALTGNPASTLGRRANVVIDAGVEREADPLNLAPTASTTAALAMADALAAALMKARGFTLDDYARNHPGGAIGSVLLTRVRDHMVEPERVPVVAHTVSLREAIHEMTAKRLGGTFVTDSDGKLAGVFTDGDLLRLFEKELNPLETSIAAVMGKNPKSTTPDTKAIEAMGKMEDHAITLLAVVDDAMRPVSALHMHDLVKAGLALWTTEKE
jgi:arabinose-5-phosphate isomerase